MLEVVSLVNFDNPKRVSYLEKSFGSFYKYNRNVKHYVFDSSRSITAQRPLYEKFRVECIHMPGSFYGERLKQAISHVQGEYFLFLPDDFNWIFPFPLKEAVQECSREKIAELKLTCRGMDWFSQAQSTPQPWFTGTKVISGETLKSCGALAVSNGWIFRDFHEQFSLACNLLRTDFARWVFNKISASAKSPGAAEKQAYIWLTFRRYKTAYYKMWTPAFHFIDLKVEPENEQNIHKARTSLIEANFETYNRHFNK
jgi:hypothetical protein